MVAPATAFCDGPLWFFNVVDDTDRLLRHAEVERTPPIIMLRKCSCFLLFKSSGRTAHEYVRPTWKVDQVIDLGSGHFPAFSRPKELADSLTELALHSERELASV